MNLRQLIRMGPLLLIVALSLACDDDSSIASGVRAKTIPSFDHLLRLSETTRLHMGVFNPLPRDAGPDSILLWGLPRQNAFFVAHVSNEEGKMYTIEMQTNRDGSNLWRLWSPGTEGLTSDPRVPADSLSLGDIDFSYVEGPPDYLRWTSDHPGFEVTIDEAQMQWKQEEVFDLHGTIPTPSLYMLVPWRRPEVDPDPWPDLPKTGTEVWTLQDYHCQGTLFGESVSGFLHVEGVYDVVDVRSGPIDAMLYGYMTTWTKVYVDGTAETGLIACGRDQFKVAIIVDHTGKEIIYTHDVTIDIEYEDDGETIARVEHILGDKGEKWVMIPEPNCQTPPMSPPHMFPGDPVRFWGPTGGWTLIYGGHMTRENEQREVLDSWLAVQTLLDQYCCKPE